MVGNIKTSRFIFIVAFIIGFAPFSPITYAPDFLRVFFSGFIGSIIPVLILLILIFWSFISFCSNLFKKTPYTDNPLEIIGIPILFFLLIFGLSPILYELRFKTISWLNNGHQVENFVNPFLGVEMKDCRRFTKKFDAIFIPAHFTTEIDILVYANQNSDLINERRKQNYSDNWFIIRTGSMWSDDLRNCALQNK